MSEYKLPELPEPYARTVTDTPLFTEYQMLAMHRQGWDEALAALRQQAGQAEPVAAQPRARVTREGLRAAARIAIMGDASTEDADMLAALRALSLDVEVSDD